MSTQRKSTTRPAIRAASTASTAAPRDARAPSEGGRSPSGGPGDGIWLRVTRELADDLAVDAPARDRAGKTPYDEVARLQEAGLPGLLTPPGDGGRGSDWRSACAVIREISAADSSVGELLAHHYLLSWSSHFFGQDPGTGSPARRKQTAEASLGARAAREHWLLAGAVEPPPPGTGPGPDLTLTPSDDGWLLDGRHTFASGVTVADRLVLAARPGGSGDALVVLVDPACPGVFTDGGPDRVGQRLAGAGTVTFDRVPVAPADVLGVLPQDEDTTAPFTTLAPLALRLLLVHVGLGITEGALAEARDVTRAGRAGDRAAPAGDAVARLGGAVRTVASDDPYLPLAYGELAIEAHAAASVVERADDALAYGLHTGRGLGAEQRAAIAVLVAAAETVTGRAAVRVTTRVLELVDGAGGPAGHDGAPGFDRFWRNARALTARTRTAHRLRDIGDHYLHGTDTRLTLPA
ncbi:acyl-CoA dehydrogenase family protein [Streptomyces sp. NPDC058855]|uniref:acyl-CoA dehydrogenase family protein n=1 Tax=Streptomyces sp. NPDC058855 TaxID=3346651 RepID=UPI00369975BD